MLCELKIENLALIDSAHLIFEQNQEASLAVMTGETGAGKSMMLRAIALLTGRRASSEWIRSGEERCTVEALFEVNDNHHQVRHLLEAGGYGTDTIIIIKRIINRKGRSRIYVNGSLATARFVSEIGALLVNIASQHDHQQLLHPPRHLDFLDTLGDHWALRRTTEQVYEKWQQARTLLSELHTRERDREQRMDFLSFQVKEIRTVSPVVGEDDELEKERSRLKSADLLIRLSRESLGILANSVPDDLAQLRKLTDQLSDHDPDVGELASDIRDFSYLAEEFESRLRKYHDGLENDPLRLEEVNERLSDLQGLKRKYGETITDIIAFSERAEQELAQIENLEKEIEDQRNRLKALENDLLKESVSLSKARKETAQLLEQEMASQLSTLSFNKAAIEVRFEAHDYTVDTIRSSGFDRVEFFLRANPGEPSRPLAKIASGGELSRLMLAMKCLLAQKDMVETIIFDEVDAGISGEAAETVARKIRELSDHHQVICITHLPQIAARGTEHLVVEKEVINNRTQSTVSILSDKDRIAELARMLAGASATEQTEAWAYELLSKGKEAA